MKQRLNTYKAYSRGCAIVWAALLLAVAARRDHTTLQNVGLVCAGWWIGWLSATIARSVYPPPKRWRGGGGT
jgi:hypothetical protein